MKNRKTICTKEDVISTNCLTLITSRRTTQLYKKKIVPGRYGSHNNIEHGLLWIIASHIRISLNLPLESKRSHTEINTWVAAANYTMKFVSTSLSVFCVLKLLSGFCVCSPFFIFFFQILFYFFQKFLFHLQVNLKVTLSLWNVK